MVGEIDKDTSWQAHLINNTKISSVIIGVMKSNASYDLIIIE